MTGGRPAVLLFVKYPTPGKVKTRLAATVGAGPAAEIYQQLVREVCARLPRDVQVIAAFDPPEKRAAIECWLAPLLPDGAAFFPQREGNLGDRLAGAFADAFAAGAPAVAAIGSDCIEISAETFRAAWLALETHDVAIGPTGDGGYYLIALKAPCAPLFAAIPWSTERTFPATVERAAALGLRVFLLETLRDIDTEEDWKFACANRTLPPPPTPALMEISDPIVFEPLFMERVWGGQRLATSFGKKLPPNSRIGESWEIVDREEAQSVVHAGVLRGQTLHELWTQHREAVFGGVPDAPRFPLLIKLLDAQERLSVQVHPPAEKAAALHGEPKTEMWYFAETVGESDVFAGLKRGVTREDFATALREGAVADKVHRIVVRRGEAIFIPSGRVHAIGAGNVIVEVQQNSDTTYRVFDWNRVGLDGKARQMHVEESMESIDFADFEPALAERKGETVTECEFFKVEELRLETPREAAPAGKFAILTCLEGRVGSGGAEFGPGEFFLMPATMPDRQLRPIAGAATLLRTTIP